MSNFLLAIITCDVELNSFLLVVVTIVMLVLWVAALIATTKAKRSLSRHNKDADL